MFDLDRFAADCRAALAEQGSVAIQEVLARAVSDAGSVTAALGEPAGPHSACLFHAPDLTILIDLDVEVALERLRLRGASNRLDVEAPAFHGRVRQAFLDLAKAEPARFEVFDGAVEGATLAERIRARVASRFGDIG